MVKVRLEFIGRGAKWALVALQLACLLNPNLVTGVDDSADSITSESRSPYIYLSQREYVLDSPTGKYTEINSSENSTTEIPVHPLKKERNQFKKRMSPSSYPSAEDEDKTAEDQSGQDSVTSQRFENAFTSFHYADNEGQQRVERSDKNPGSIQDILHHRQGHYVRVTSTPGYTTAETPGQAPSYDSIHYQSPLVSYEVPSNYFPNEHFDWPSSYGPPPSSSYGPPTSHGGSGGGGGGGPGSLIVPFVNGVGQLTGSVKHLKSQLGEQKAQKAFQIAEVVRETGNAVNNAILNKGQAAGQVIGQTIQTAGDVLANKGWKAQQIIQNKGQLATSAIQSVGNIGSSLLRSKGELVGALVKTGANIGTSALGVTSNALAGGTYLVKAKGDAASNLIAKGGRLASGVIGTKGRLISNVINAKGQFVAQIVEAKGRAAATLLETSGQKLTQLAEAIKSATAQKARPQPTIGWGSSSGWGSENQESYAAPPAASEQSEEKVKPTAELQKEEEPVISNHQHAHQYQPQSYQQDYQDSYYDPRDTYRRNGRASKSNTSRRSSKEEKESVRDQGRNSAAEESNDDDREEFQNEYSSYYLPYSYSPSEHQDYAQVQYTPEPW